MKQGNSTSSLSARPSEHGTPRTDAEALWPACDDSSDKYSPDGAYVGADFARQIERENAELLGALTNLVSCCENSGFDYAIKERQILMKEARAILAKVGK